MGVLKDKCVEFAVTIIRLCRELTEEKKEYVISKQLLRSGTSIGASVHEGEFAQSPKDFISKYSISVKEANESMYWLELLKATGYIDKDKYSELTGLCRELIKMLVSSIKTVNKKLEKQ